MAKYYNNKGKQRTINLCKSKLRWEIVDMDEEYIEVAREERWVAIAPSEWLDDYFEDVNPLYPDESYAKYVKLYYTYDESDTLCFRPLASYLAYPAADVSLDVDVPTYEFERDVSLSKDEIKYFSGLLQAVIGDQHSLQMQRVMLNYHNAVDRDLRVFIQDVLSGREVLPMTVGFVSERMAEDIQKLTGVNTLGNRIVIGADDVRHIIKRHGEAGKADRSMQDIDDIARLSYVLANYDFVEWDGRVSPLYKTKDGKKAPQVAVKKKIDGTYYVIEVASDASRKRNVVSTIYLKKEEL